MVRDAARHLDDDSPEKVAMCAMAKLYATDNCFEVSDKSDKKIKMKTKSENMKN